jgi:hypothetical protein
LAKAGHYRKYGDGEIRGFDGDKVEVAFADGQAPQVQAAIPRAASAFPSVLATTPSSLAACASKVRLGLVAKPEQRRAR